ncbi:MAG: radical SAM protein [Bdellovibrionales bacterium]|nr:radical SAM protein [Bdellovibrionales bacterium]
MKYAVRTLGCKANLYDSQLIEAELQRMGLSPAAAGERADVCVVNSCTVTNEAEKQSRGMASRLSREHPGAKVVLTGCSAEIAPESLRAARGVDFVLSNRDKPRFGGLLRQALGADRGASPSESAGQAELLGDARGYEELRSRHPLDREWPLPEEVAFTPSELQREGEPPPGVARNSSSRTRAFLKIQEGCDSFCTFCIIPYGRGPSRSLRAGDAVAQVQRLVEQGVREVVLTGTNIGQYGMDWSGGGRTTDDGYGDFQLEALCRAILERTSLERLRVSSLDPGEISSGLLALMESEPRFCPHFHVSLQSPHSRILRLMKRKYGAEEVRGTLERIAALGTSRRPFVGMDLITGFPGESAEIFEETLSLLRALPWDRLHVFPYSEREGTPSTRLPGSVPVGERKRRARVLNALSLERLRARYEGTLSEGRLLDDVLIEGPCRGPDGQRRWAGGYTRDYLRVLLPLSDSTTAARSNAVVSARALSLAVDPAGGDVVLLAARA